MNKTTSQIISIKPHANTMHLTDHQFGKNPMDVFELVLIRTLFSQLQISICLFGWLLIFNQDYSQ